MLLFAVVILSVVTVRPAGGSISALGRVRLRYTPAIFGALAIQIAIVSVVPGGSPWLHRVLHIGSYALAAVFVVANRRLAGMRVLGLGATKHAFQPGEAAGENFRVYLDPVGHPFCLCWD